MPSDEYIKKYAHKSRLTRSSAEIQAPIVKPEKHIIPVDLITRRVVNPRAITDHQTLEDRSAMVRSFIRNGR